MSKTSSGPGLFSARRDRAAAMPFILMAALIDMISIGIIIPVLPALVGSFTGSQVDQALWYGVATFTFSIANFFGSPVLGALSDSFGRRPVLLIGFCGLAVNFFATALATSMWMLIAARLVGGSESLAKVAALGMRPQLQPRNDLVGGHFGPNIKRAAERSP